MSSCEERRLWKCACACDPRARLTNQGAHSREYDDVTTTERIGLLLPTAIDPNSPPPANVCHGFPLSTSIPSAAKPETETDTSAKRENVVSCVMKHAASRASFHDQPGSVQFSGQYISALSRSRWMQAFTFSYSPGSTASPPPNKAFVLFSASTLAGAQRFLLRSSALEGGLCLFWSGCYCLDVVEKASTISTVRSSADSGRLS